MQGESISYNKSTQKEIIWLKRKGKKKSKGLNPNPILPNLFATSNRSHQLEAAPQGCWQSSEWIFFPLSPLGQISLGQEINNDLRK